MPESSKTKIYRFVTANEHKYHEASELLEKYNLKLQMISLDKREIQSSDINEIAIESAREAFSTIKNDLLVEDAGLFIDVLNGFPGPYSSYVYKTLGVKRILGLLNGVNSRGATFKSVVAYSNGKGSIKSFAGITKGVITNFTRGKNGFGFDPIFIPNGSSRTYAEMALEEKSYFSHRSKAFRRFVGYLSSRNGI